MFEILRKDTLNLSLPQQIERDVWFFPVTQEVLRAVTHPPVVAPGQEALPQISYE
jgi:hypothetical protein